MALTLLSPEPTISSGLHRGYQLVLLIRLLLLREVVAVAQRHRGSRRVHPVLPHEGAPAPDIGSRMGHVWRATGWAGVWSCRSLGCPRCSQFHEVGRPVRESAPPSPRWEGPGESPHSNPDAPHRGAGALGAEICLNLLLVLQDI